MYVMSTSSEVSDDHIGRCFSLGLRVFSDAANSMWKANVKDIDGDILCVSQFTLMANTAKGNKPDFHNAMVCHCSLPSVSTLINSSGALSQATEPSRQMYGSFLDALRHSYKAEKIKGINARTGYKTLVKLFQMADLVL